MAHVTVYAKFDDGTSFETTVDMLGTDNDIFKSREVTKALGIASGRIIAKTTKLYGG